MGVCEKTHGPDGLPPLPHGVSLAGCGASSILLRTEISGSSWEDICNYQDTTGSYCCAPGMEDSEYYVLPYSQSWMDLNTICRYSDQTGNLVVLENMEEWACLMHYISDKFPGVNRKYAISLRAEEDFEGVYRWQYRDGRTEIPDYFVWGNGHPRDKACVSMEIGTGADRQGAWLDGDCLGEHIYAVCERRKH